ncbi:hypothetical protein FNYG_11672 [Fusarium nygamai]|uniref:Uncharacterized protein n=1 Tax=Gibberella nygamai TaxID=42673 RepID=A0A2K0VYC5_GIBNY|nr:hypothetical protein FNYG_11672 [Fusarium nygamai]
MIGLGHVFSVTVKLLLDNPKNQFQDWWTENIDWIVDGCRELTSTFGSPDKIEAQEHEELEQAEIDAPFSDVARHETPDRGTRRKARDDGRNEGTIKKQDTGTN